MFGKSQASIAAFGYRQPPAAGFAAIVSAIDAILQNTDAQPRKIRWVGSHIALIDRLGVRIALGFLPPSSKDRYSHLIIAVGERHDGSDDGILSVSTVHLTDKLMQRIKEDMPYDTIMRGETPENVNEELIEAMFDLLRQTPTPETQDDNVAQADRQIIAQNGCHAALEHRFDIIQCDELEHDAKEMPEWLSRRATSTNPLRLTVHTVALSVMLYTPPLGAFMFTYSMLRDVANNS